jgi:two-component system chemotaxis response regulator CheB
VLSVHEIGQEIVRLAREPRLQEVTMSNPGPRRAAQQVAEQTSEDPRPGARSAYACPDCGGALWEVESNGLLRFRCRIGHAYSEASMLDRQSHALENSLWTSLRVLEERAALCRRLSARLEQRGSGATANSFVHQAEEAERVAVQLKLLLESPDLLRLPDPVSDQG